MFAQFAILGFLDYLKRKVLIPPQLKQNFFISDHQFYTNEPFSIQVRSYVTENIDLLRSADSGNWIIFTWNRGGIQHSNFVNFATLLAKVEVDPVEPLFSTFKIRNAAVGFTINILTNSFTVLELMESRIHVYDTRGKNFDYIIQLSKPPLKTQCKVYIGDLSIESISYSGDDMGGLHNLQLSATLHFPVISEDDNLYSVVKEINLVLEDQTQSLLEVTLLA